MQKAKVRTDLKDFLIFTVNGEEVKQDKWYNSKYINDELYIEINTKFEKVNSIDFQFKN